MHLAHRRYGFSPCCGYGAYGGAWEDAILWFHAHLPTWLTGTVTVDVPATPQGEIQLAEIMPTLEGKTVLISASTQYLLWRMLRDNLTMVDEMYVRSWDMPEEYGNVLRHRLDTKRAEIKTMAQNLFNQNEAALAAGVPPAIKRDWILVEMEETAVVPVELLVVLGVMGLTAIIATGMIIAGTVLYKVWASYQDTSVMKDGIDKVLALGRPDLVVQMLGKARKAAEEAGGTSWAWWGLGIGGAALGTTIFLAFLFGQIKRISQ